MKYIVSQSGEWHWQCITSFVRCIALLHIFFSSFCLTCNYCTWCIVRGADFRPAYKRSTSLRGVFTDAVCVALSATVNEDIYKWRRHQSASACGQHVTAARPSERQPRRHQSQLYDCRAWLGVAGTGCRGSTAKLSENSRLLQVHQRRSGRLRMANGQTMWKGLCARCIEQLQSTGVCFPCPHLRQSAPVRYDGVPKTTVCNQNSDCHKISRFWTKLYLYG